MFKKISINLGGGEADSYAIYQPFHTGDNTKVDKSSTRGGEADSYAIFKRLYSDYESEYEN